MIFYHGRPFEIYRSFKARLLLTFHYMIFQNNIVFADCITNFPNGKRAGRSPIDF